MTEEERMNEYALGAYRAAMLARGRVPEPWSKLGSRRRRSWRAAARTVLQMHVREQLGGPLLAPLGMVEDRTLEQRIADGDADPDVCPTCGVGKHKNGIASLPNECCVKFFFGAESWATDGARGGPHPREAVAVPLRELRAARARTNRVHPATNALPIRWRT